MSTNEALKDFTAGCVGGFAGKLVDYPFDTIKVLLQTQNVTASKAVAPGQTPPMLYRGAWHCFTHTLTTKGFFGLYNGLSAPLIGSCFENATLFLAYGKFKKLLGEEEGVKELSLLELSMAGAGAGLVVPFVLTPVELIKCRLQVQNSISSEFRAYKGSWIHFFSSCDFSLSFSHFFLTCSHSHFLTCSHISLAGPIDCIVQTVKSEGIVNGLYKGHAATLLREIPGNFFWYGVYETTCHLMIPEGGTKKDVGTGAHLLGGAMAGMSYWTAFYPADTVKSALQTNPDFAKKSFVQTFLGIYRNEGMSALYRGWGVTVMRAAPAHALIFACYEETLKWL
jgi:hypothetical protein